MITVRFETMDGCNKSKKFVTLKGAQRYAQERLGETPDISWQFHYAVGSFGDAKITVHGEDKDGKPISIFDLYPRVERPVYP